MKTRLELTMQPQPDDTTCGPTCLHAIYRYHRDAIGLAQVVTETSALEDGGTLGVFLANHALRRGYRVTIFTYNLHVFDPTWFNHDAEGVEERLRAQMHAKGDRKLGEASLAYIEFLQRGGRLRFQDLSAGLVRQHLDRGLPILTGLSATYLYRSAREISWTGQPDDVRGEPSGHFVVLCGYDPTGSAVLVADPAAPNPYSDDHFYEIAIDRVLGAILLGIVTHDANLVLVEPDGKAEMPGGEAEKPDGDPEGPDGDAEKQP